MITKLCPVQRPVYGFIIQKPVVGSPLHQNGMPAKVEIQVQQINNSAHELTVIDDDYMLMCKFCAAIASQANWYEILSSEEVSEPQTS
jgi:hypothetical protein